MVGRVWTLFWIVTSVLTSDGAALGMTASEIVKSRPNINLIQVDDTGWADGVCFGSEFYRMRALDALAGSAARFTQVYAFTSVNHGRPICLQLEHYAVHGPLMGERWMSVPLPAIRAQMLVPRTLSR